MSTHTDLTSAFMSVVSSVRQHVFRMGAGMPMIHQQARTCLFEFSMTLVVLPSDSELFNGAHVPQSTDDVIERKIKYSCWFTFFRFTLFLYE